MSVTCVLGYLPTNFGLPSAFGSRVIHYVRDRQTDRQTDGRTKAKHTAPFPTGGGIITNGLIRQRIGPKRRPQCQRVCPVWYGKYGSIFIHFYTASPGKATWRRSRSFKVIETGTNRKSICDFLLVFHCNYVPIFYRCRVLTIYLAQIGVFRLLSHRSFV